MKKALSIRSAASLRPTAIALPLIQARWSLLPAALLPLAALANPTGGVVVAGQATIQGGSGLTTIQQQSASAVINWQQFGIGSGETVNFVQPSASAAILNRITGGNASEIFGNLTSNGRVLLINPQGVMFGAGARVDVGGLLASTLEISNEDFMAGRYVLNGSQMPGSVSNDGLITARDGGFVVLAGGNVRNGGLIQTRFGDVLLASGSGLTLDIGDSGLVGYRIDGAALADTAGVTNTGELMADGGRVFMSAEMAQGLAATAVNNSGIVRASSIGEQDGEIVLSASGGNIENSGQISASAESSGLADGGQIDLRSDRDIHLAAGSRIDADGAQGGRIDIVAARRLDLDSSSQISALAQSPTGLGGALELSGHEALTVRGAINLGRGGRLLIDPATITIADGYGGQSGSTDVTIFEQDIESQLQQGTSVTLAADNAIVIQDLSDNVLDGRNAGYGGDLSLLIGSIDAYGGFTAGPSGSISMTASDAVAVDGAIDFRSGTDSGDLSLGSISSGRMLQLRAADQLTAAALSGPTVNLITALGSLTAGNVTATAGGVVVGSGGLISLGDILASASNTSSGSFSSDATASIDLRAERGSIRTGNLSALATNQGDGFTTATATVRLFAAPDDAGNASIETGSIRAEATAMTSNQGDTLFGEGSYSASANASVNLDTGTASFQFDPVTGSGTTTYTRDGHILVNGGLSSIAEASTLDAGDFLGSASGLGQLTINSTAGDLTTGTITVDDQVNLATFGNSDFNLAPAPFFPAGNIVTGDINTLGGNLSISGGSDVSLGNLSASPDGRTNFGQVAIRAVGALNTPTLNTGTLFSARNISLSAGADLLLSQLSLVSTDGSIDVFSSGRLELGSVSAQTDQNNAFSTGNATIGLQGRTGVSTGQLTTQINSTASDFFVNLSGSISVFSSAGGIQTGDISAQVDHRTGIESSSFSSTSTANIDLRADRGSIRTGNISAQASDQSEGFTNANASVRLTAGPDDAGNASIETGFIQAFASANTFDQGDLRFGENSFSATATASVDLSTSSASNSFDPDTGSFLGTVYTRDGHILVNGGISSLADASTQDAGDLIGTAFRSGQLNLSSTAGDVTTGTLSADNRVSLSATSNGDFNLSPPTIFPAGNILTGDIITRSGEITINGGSQVTTGEIRAANLGINGVGDVSLGNLSAGPNVGDVFGVVSLAAGGSLNTPTLSNGGLFSAQTISLSAGTDLLLSQLNLASTDGRISVSSGGRLEIGSVSTQLDETTPTGPRDASITLEGLTGVQAGQISTQIDSTSSDFFTSHNGSIRVSSNAGGIQTGDISAQASRGSNGESASFFSDIFANIDVRADNGNIRTGNITALASNQDEGITAANAIVRLTAAADAAGNASIETGSIRAEALASTSDQGDALFGDNSFSATATATIDLNTASSGFLVDPATGASTAQFFTRDGHILVNGSVTSLAQTSTLDGGINIGAASDFSSVTIGSTAGDLTTGTLTANDRITLTAVSNSDFNLSPPPLFPAGNILTGDISTVQGDLSINGGSNVSLGNLSAGPNTGDTFGDVLISAGGTLNTLTLSDGGLLTGRSIALSAGADLLLSQLNLASTGGRISATSGGRLELGSIATQLDQVGGSLTNDASITLQGRNGVLTGQLSTLIDEASSVTFSSYSGSINISSAEGDIQTGDISTQVARANTTEVLSFSSDATANVNLSTNAGSIRTGNISASASNQDVGFTTANASIQISTAGDDAGNAVIETGSLRAEAQANTTEQGDALFGESSYSATANATVNLNSSFVSNRFDPQTGSFSQVFTRDGHILVNGDVTSLAGASTLDAGSVVGTATDFGQINLFSTAGDLTTGAITASDVVNLNAVSNNDFNVSPPTFLPAGNILTGDIRTFSSDLILISGGSRISLGNVSAAANTDLNISGGGDVTFGALSAGPNAGDAFGDVVFSAGGTLNTLPVSGGGLFTALSISLSSGTDLLLSQLNLASTDGRVSVTSGGRLEIGNISTQLDETNAFSASDASIVLQAADGVQAGQLSTQINSSTADFIPFQDGSIRVTSTAGGIETGDLSAEVARGTTQGTAFNSSASANIDLNAGRGSIRTGNITALASDQGEGFTSASATVRLFAAPDDAGNAFIETGAIRAEASASTSDQGDATFGDSSYSATANASVALNTASSSFRFDPQTGSFSQVYTRDGHILVNGDVTSLVGASTLDAGSNVGNASDLGTLTIGSVAGDLSTGALTISDRIDLNTTGNSDFNVSPATVFPAGNILTGDITIVSGDLININGGRNVSLGDLSTGADAGLSISGSGDVSFGALSAGPDVGDAFGDVVFSAGGSLNTMSVGSGGVFSARSIALTSGTDLLLSQLNLASTDGRVSVTSGGRLEIGNVSTQLDETNAFAATDASITLQGADGVQAGQLATQINSTTADFFTSQNGSITVSASAGGIQTGDISTQVLRSTPEGSSFSSSATANVDLNAGRGNIRTGNITALAVDQGDGFTSASATVRLSAAPDDAGNASIETGAIRAEALANTSDQGDATFGESSYSANANASIDLNTITFGFRFDPQTGGGSFVYTSDGHILINGGITSLAEASTLDGGMFLGATSRLSQIRIGSTAGDLTTGAITADDGVTLSATSNSDVNLSPPTVFAAGNILTGDINTLNGDLIISSGSNVSLGRLSAGPDASDTFGDVLLSAGGALNVLNLNNDALFTARSIDLTSGSDLLLSQLALVSTDGQIRVSSGGRLELGSASTRIDESNLSTFRDASIFLQGTTGVQTGQLSTQIDSITEDFFTSRNASISIISAGGDIQTGDLSTQVMRLSTPEMASFSSDATANIDLSANGGSIRTGNISALASSLGDGFTSASATVRLLAAPDDAGTASIETGSIRAEAVASSSDQGDALFGESSYSANANASVSLEAASNRFRFDPETGSGSFVYTRNGHIIVNGDLTSTATASTLDAGSAIGTAFDSGTVNISSRAGDLVTAGITADDSITLTAFSNSDFNLSPSTFFPAGTVFTGDVTTLDGDLFISGGQLALGSVSALGVGGDVMLSTTVGDLLIGNVSATGTVTATSAAAVVDDGIETTGISASIVNLTAFDGNIGSAADTGTAVGSGYIDLLTTPLALSVSASNGQASLNFTEGDVSLGAVDGTLADNITDLNLAVSNGTAILIADALQLGAANLDLRAQNIAFVGDAVGLPEITTTGNLSLNAFNGNITDASDTNEALDIIADGIFTLAASGSIDPLEINVGSLVINQTLANITLTEQDDIALNRLSATGTIRVTSLSGAITDGNGDTVNAESATVILSAANGIGTLTDAIEINSGSVQADTPAGSVVLTNLNTGSTSITGLTAGDAIVYQQATGTVNVDGLVQSGLGGVFIDPTDVNLNALVDGGGGAVSIEADNDITFNDGGSIANASSVTLTADADSSNVGAIVDAQLSELTDITAGSVVLRSGSGVGSLLNVLEIDTADVTAQVSGNGDIVLDNLSAVGSSLAATVLGDGEISVFQVGAGDLVVSNATTANGLIQLNNTAPGGGISAQNIAAGGAAGAVLIDTDAATGGDITLGTVSSVNDIAARAGGDLLVAGAVTGGAASSISLTAGRLILNTIDSNDGANRLTAGTVNLTAVSGIGFDDLTATQGRISTDADSINASVTGDGSLFLRNHSADAVNFNTLSTAGLGFINVNQRGVGGLSGAATFTNVTANTGFVVVGSIDSAVTILNGSALGSDALNNEGVFAAFTGAPGAPLFDLTIGTLTASTSAQLGAQGNILDGNGAGQINIIAPELALTSAGLVDLDTAVVSATTSTNPLFLASNGVMGSITLREADDLTISNLAAGAGLTVTAGGAITAERIDIFNVNGATGGDVVLTGSSIGVNTIGGGGLQAAMLMATTGAISEAGASDANAEIAAATVVLTAATGIGGNFDALGGLNLFGASSVSASSTTGDVNVINFANGAVTVNTLATDATSSLLYRQGNAGAGGSTSLSVGTAEAGNVTIQNFDGSLSVANAAATAGILSLSNNLGTTSVGTLNVLAGTATDDIRIANNNGNVTIGSLTAGDGTTAGTDIAISSNSSGNVTISGSLNALGNDVLLDSIGGISGLAGSAINAQSLNAIARNGDITLNTDIDFLTAGSTGALVIDEASALDVLSLTAGSLSLTSAGAITDSGMVTVAGNSVLDAGGNALALDTLSNDFGGVVTATAGSITLVDQNDLTAGTLSASEGNVSLTAAGSLNADAITALGSGSSVVIDGDSGVEVGQINLNGGALDVRSLFGDVRLAAFSGGAAGLEALGLQAGGRIVVDSLDATTDPVTWTAGVIRIQSGLDFNHANLSLNAINGGIGVSSDGVLTLGDLSTAGDGSYGFLGGTLFDSDVFASSGGDLTIGSITGSGNVFVQTLGLGLIEAAASQGGFGTGAAHLVVGDIVADNGDFVTIDNFSSSGHIAVGAITGAALGNVSLSGNGLLRINDGVVFTLAAESIRLRAGGDTTTVVGLPDDALNGETDDIPLLALDAPLLSLQAGNGGIVVTAGSLQLIDVDTGGESVESFGSFGSSFGSAGSIRLANLSTSASSSDFGQSVDGSINVSSQGGSVVLGALSTAVLGGSLGAFGDVHVEADSRIDIGSISTSAEGTGFAQASVSLFAHGDITLTGPITTNAVTAAQAAVDPASCDGPCPVNFDNAFAEVGVQSNSGSVLVGDISTTAISGSALAASGNPTTALASVFVLNGSSADGAVTLETGSISTHAQSFGTEALFDDGETTQVVTADSAEASILLATDRNGSTDVNGVMQNAYGGSILVNGSINLSALSGSETTSVGNLDATAFGGRITLNGPAEFSPGSHVNLLTRDASYVDQSTESFVLVDAGEITLNAALGSAALAPNSVRIESGDALNFSDITAGDVTLTAFGTINSTALDGHLSATSLTGSLAVQAYTIEDNVFVAQRVSGSSISLNAAQALVTSGIFDTTMFMAQGLPPPAAGTLSIIAGFGTANLVTDTAPGMTGTVVLADDPSEYFNQTQFVTQNLLIQAQTISISSPVQIAGDLALVSTAGDLSAQAISVGRELSLDALGNINAGDLTTGGTLSIISSVGGLVSLGSVTDLSSGLSTATITGAAGIDITSLSGFLGGASFFTNGTLGTTSLSAGSLNLDALNIVSQHNSGLTLVSTLGDIQLFNASINVVPPATGPAIVIDSAGSVIGNSQAALNGGAGAVNVFSNNGGSIVLGAVSGGDVQVGDDGSGTRQIGDITLAGISLTRSLGSASVVSNGGNIGIGGLMAAGGFDGLSATVVASSGSTEINNLSPGFASLSVVGETGLGEDLVALIGTAVVSGTDLSLRTNGIAPLNFGDVTANSLSFVGGSNTRFNSISTAGLTSLETAGFINTGDVSAESILLNGGEFAGGALLARSGTLTGNVTQLTAASLEAAQGIDLASEGGSIVVSGASTSSEGNVSMQLGTGSLDLGRVDALSGAVSLAGGSIQLASIMADTASVQASQTLAGRAGQPLRIDTANGIDVAAASGVSVGAGGSLALTAQSGDIVVASPGGITAAGVTVQANGGNVQLGSINSTAAVLIDGQGSVTTGDIAGFDSVQVFSGNDGDILLGNVGANGVNSRLVIGERALDGVIDSGNIITGTLSSQGQQQIFSEGGSITLGGLNGGTLSNVQSSGGSVQLGPISNAAAQVILRGRDGLSFTSAPALNTFSATDLTLDIGSTAALTLGDLNTRRLALAGGSGTITLGTVSATETLAITTGTGQLIANVLTGGSGVTLLTGSADVNSVASGGNLSGTFTGASAIDTLAATGTVNVRASNGLLTVSNGASSTGSSVTLAGQGLMVGSVSALTSATLTSSGPGSLNLAGPLTVSGGGATLSSAGNIVLGSNSSASGSFSISSGGSITGSNAGGLSLTGGRLSLIAPGTISSPMLSLTSTAGDLMVSAASVNSPLLSLTASGNLLTGSTLLNAGSTGSITLVAGSGTVNLGNILANNLSVTAPAITAPNLLALTGNISLSAANELVVDALTSTGGDINLSGSSISAGSLQALDAIGITTSGLLSLQSLIAGTATLAAGSGYLSRNGVDLQIVTTAGDLSLAGGPITAPNLLLQSAGQLTRSAPINVTGTTSLQAAVGGISLADLSSGNLAVTASTIDNPMALTVEGDLLLNSTSGNIATGALTAGGTLLLQSAAAISTGSLQAASVDLLSGLSGGITTGDILAATGSIQVVAPISDGPGINIRVGNLQAASGSVLVLAGGIGSTTEIASITAGGLIEVDNFAQDNYALTTIGRIIGGSDVLIGSTLPNHALALGDITANGSIMLQAARNLVAGALTGGNLVSAISSTGAVSIRSASSNGLLELLAAGNITVTGNLVGGRGAEDTLDVLTQTGAISLAAVSGGEITLGLAGDGSDTIAAQGPLSVSGLIDGEGRVLVQSGGPLITLNGARSATDEVIVQGLDPAAVGGNDQTGIVASGLYTAMDGIFFGTLGGGITLNNAQLGSDGLITLDAAVDSNFNGGDVRLSNTQVSSLPGAGVTLVGGNITLSADSLLDDGPITLNAANQILLDNSRISNGAITTLSADTIRSVGNVSIEASALSAVGEVIDLASAALVIGADTAPGASDFGLLAALSSAGSSLLPVTPPNGFFDASASLALGQVSGTAHYIVLRAPVASLSGLEDFRGASDLFLHFAPTNLTQDFQFSLGQIAFARNVDTFAFGSSGYSGAIFVNTPQAVAALSGLPPDKVLSANGDNTNYVFLSSGLTTGAPALQAATTGRVVVLGPEPEPPPPPVPAPPMPTPPAVPPPAPAPVPMAEPELPEDLPEQFMVLLETQFDPGEKEGGTLDNRSSPGLNDLGEVLVREEAAPPPSQQCSAL